MAPRVTCECGECHKCKRRAYMRTWYAKNAERHRITAKESRQRRLAYVQEYDRARGFRKYDEEKVRARAALNHAIARGELTKGPCEVCGERQTDGHHEDYSSPLAVRWLCRKHHSEIHRKYR